MFPTTLASMGVKIEGDKLALGTNLFSKEKTINERLGYAEVTNGFRDNSKFYNSKFLYKD